MDTILLIGIGGFVGANVRYGVSGWVAVWVANNTCWSFPLGTMLVNITGSCLLAAFIVWSSNRLGMAPRLRLLVATGFFGGYTTFSTYALESISLLQAGDWAGGRVNMIGTNILALLGVLLGLAIGSRLSG